MEILHLILYERANGAILGLLIGGFPPIWIEAGVWRRAGGDFPLILYEQI